MKETRHLLTSHGYPGRDLYDLPASSKRFPDGAQYRVELPSVEGPAALGMDLVQRYCPAVVMSAAGAADLGIPVAKQ